MAPPSGAVPPDSTVGEYGFDFTRFGIRVPAVLVSPLIEAGTVFRPPGDMPLDHTSVLKTVETRWGLPALTARDGAAQDVGDVLTLTTARTDDPLAGVTAPVSSGANPAAGQVSHLQQVQAEMVSHLPVPLARVSTSPLLAHQHTPDDFEHYISARTALWQGERGGQH